MRGVAMDPQQFNPNQPQTGTPPSVGDIPPATPTPSAVPQAAPVPAAPLQTPPQPRVQQPMPPVAQVTEPSQPSGAQQPMPPTKSKSKLKVGLLALALLLFVGGGSAAAYFGVMVPNKPENVLKSAMKNSLEEQSVTTKISMEGKTDDSPSFKMQATTKASRQDKTFDMDLKGTVTGVSVSAQMRYVDKSMYVRLGDMSNVTDLIGTYAPDYKELVTTVNGKVADKWFEIDSTLLKEANADCALDTSVALEKADYELLDKLYTESKFVTIDSTSTDTVASRTATKYQLTIDHKKGSVFAQGLENLSVIKKLSACDKQLAETTSSLDKEVSGAKVEGQTAVSVWVDKGSKRIAKMALQSTEKDKKDGIDGKLEVEFDYSAVTVSKPEGAKPITTLLSELGPLFMDSMGAGAGSSSN